MKRAFIVIALTACSHTTIGPDDAGGDASLIDGALPDGSTNDAAPDGKAGDQSFQSGTRLKVRYNVSSDGAQQALGFYDSQRSENCNFMPASDGVLRCLPSVTTLSGFFTDGNCTSPLAATSKGCAPATEISTATTAATCGTGTKYDVATVGAAYTGAQVFYKAPTCTGIASTTYSASFDLYSTTSIVAPTSFQDGTTVTK